MVCFLGFFIFFEKITCKNPFLYYIYRRGVGGQPHGEKEKRIENEKIHIESEFE